MRTSKLRREIRFLRCYALGVTVLGGAIVLAGAVQRPQPAQFDRMIVHRIDVVDRAGKLAMVLTSHDDFPPPIINGKRVKRASGNENGILFYNEDGNEQGALIWDGRAHTRDGAQSGNALSFDTSDSDQLLQVFDGTDNGKHSAGIVAWDRSPQATALALRMHAEVARAHSAADRAAIRHRYREVGAYGFTRFYAGYGQDDESQVALSDGRGRIRVKLFVTKQGRAELQFLDESGKVVDAYPRPSPSPSSSAGG